VGQFPAGSPALAVGIPGHQLVTVGDQGRQRLLVGHGANGAKGDLGRCLLGVRQAKSSQQADVHPANVKFKRLDRELGRCGVGVVVVVQLLAGNHDAPGRNIGAAVERLKVAITPEVAHAVDDAGGHHRAPDHLHGPDGNAGSAEQRDVDQRHQHHPQHRMRRVHMALQPVVRRAMAKALEGLRLGGLGAVQLRAAQQHGAQAIHLRTVRVFGLLAAGVVLAVHGRPFACDHAGGQPQPEAEEVRGQRVQIQRPVRLVAVQEHGDADHGDVGQHQGDQNDLPPGQVQGAMRHPIQQGLQ